MLFPSLNDAFVVALEVIVSVLEVTKPLSVRLQGATQDIHNMSETVRDCITTLQGVRTSVPSKTFATQLVSKKCHHDQKKLGRPL